MCPSNYNRFSDRARYWSKIVIFSYPLAFDAPVRGVPVGLRPSRSFGMEKLEWLGYQIVKKNFEDILIRFGATHKRDRQMDRQTPRAGNSALMHSIARQKCDKIAIFGLTHWLKHRITRKLLKYRLHAARGLGRLASIEFPFHPCNILRDNGRGVSRGNKNVGCGTWKWRFFCTCGSINGKLLKING